jgi:hypothetical protein
VQQFFRRHKSIFGRQTPQLVGLRLALIHQTGAHPVYGLDILLLDGFNCDKTHARPAHRFTDRFGIVRVVLIALDVGLNELRSDQLHRVSLCL